jgi:hypothetical protein
MNNQLKDNTYYVMILGNEISYSTNEMINYLFSVDLYY